MSPCQGTDPRIEVLWQLLAHNLAHWDITHLTTGGADRDPGMPIIASMTSI